MQIEIKSTTVDPFIRNGEYDERIDVVNAMKEIK